MNNEFSRKSAMCNGEIELCKLISEWGALYLQFNDEIGKLEAQLDNLYSRRKTACEEYKSAIEKYHQLSKQERPKLGRHNIANSITKTA